MKKKSWSVVLPEARCTCSRRAIAFAQARVKLGSCLRPTVVSEQLYQVRYLRS